MILHDPFRISARLLPAVRISSAGWLSLDPSTAIFYLDTPNFEHVIDDFRPGASRDLQDWFAAILCFMEAAGESRQYRERMGYQLAECDDEHETLFPAHVVDWIVEHINEIEGLHSDLVGGPQGLIETKENHHAVR